MGNDPLTARVFTHPRPLERPVVLAIGGSDSSAGAGVQADVKAVAANGGYARTVVTAVTAQSSRGVTASEPVSPRLVEAQIAAAWEDSPPAAVKAGMLTCASTVEAVATALRIHPPRAFVLDPVIRSSSGAALLDAAGVEALVRLLVPLSDLVTPNAREAEVLTGLSVRSARDAELAGRRILDLGARAVLVKGGHLAEDRACDVLVTVEGLQVFEGAWQEGRDVHGTGCAYASAIATHLAHGARLDEAVARAKRYMDALIASAVRVGEGALLADHFSPPVAADEEAP